MSTCSARARGRRRSSVRVLAFVAESHVLAVFGPTASGKTDVAVAVAERIPAELVSADAMQLYRGLPILTNQPPHPAHLGAARPLGRAGPPGEARVPEAQR